MLCKRVRVQVILSNWTVGVWWWSTEDGLLVGLSLGPVEIVAGREV